MAASVETHPYTMAAVRRMSGLSRHAIARLVDLGFVSPVVRERRYRYSFQDAVLLRSASELRAANIPTRRILAALRQLRQRLPPDAPTGGLRLGSDDGHRIAVRSGSLRWEPTSGQLVLEMEAADSLGAVHRFEDPGAAGNMTGRAVDTRFAEAEGLEDVDPAAAERGYRALLRDDPAHAHAYLNLGFMLCEARRFEEAESLYRDARRHCEDDPLILFNHAVALEAMGRNDEALAAYEQSLVLDPRLLDAHQNAALLYSEMGQPQMAIRHFSAYRRLR
ncbi:MAG: tetratricopeptide repeat protein [Bordetella sp.]|nr:tetratricopeptide repeat protein [Bordetella sp.]